MDEFKLLLICADRLFYNGPCVSVVVPAQDGAWGIMAHHAEMVAAVVPGELHFTTPDGAVKIVAVGSGYVQVNKRDVLVLTDIMEWPDEIDQNKVQREYEEAREALRQAKSQKEYKLTQGALARALGQMKVKNHH